MSLFRHLFPNREITGGRMPESAGSDGLASLRALLLACFQLTPLQLAFPFLSLSFLPHFRFSVPA
jgi:hypothetical protein